MRANESPTRQPERVATELIADCPALFENALEARSAVLRKLVTATRDKARPAQGELGAVHCLEERLAILGVEIDGLTKVT